MSYYGIRKIKTIKTTNNKYNITCEYYDSSITDHKGNRIWNTCNSTGLFKEPFNTLKELEYALFTDMLDGNIHPVGNVGKYTCLSWDNFKLSLPLTEETKLKELSSIKDNLYYSKEHTEITNKLKELKVPYTEWETHPLYKDLYTKITKARTEYMEYRYNVYFKAWKNYLKEIKTENKLKEYYIISCNYKNIKEPVYVKNKSRLCHSVNLSKIFHLSLNQIKTFIKQNISNNSISNISIINVTKYITKENKKISLCINSNLEKELLQNSLNIS